MTYTDICKRISQNLAHNLRLANSDNERLDYLTAALQSFSDSVIPSLNSAYERFGEGNPELEKVRAPALELATFICGELVRKCTRYSRGIDSIEAVSAGCHDPQMKKKLVFYTNQLKKRWNVVEPGGLVHNPRAKRVRTEFPASSPSATVLKALVVIGVCLFLFNRMNHAGIGFSHRNDGEQTNVVPQGQVQNRSEMSLQGDNREQSQVQSEGSTQVKTPAGAFYTYTDSQGVVHMVDNLERVPQKYRQGMKVTESVQPHRANTPVLIRGNQVIVPVTIVFRGRAVETRLLLDTGASFTTINEDLAAKLGVGGDSVRAGKSTVADGRTVGSYRFSADSIAVDDHLLPSAETSILPGSGGKGYEGLLGMNYLKNFRYHVNFDQRMIEWGQ